jgi:hypothetical protein
MAGSDRADEEAEAAAAEAAAIGAKTSSEPEPTDGRPNEAERPVVEAGGGEAEGFEQAERELIEHASHGDQHAARRAIEDVPDFQQDARAAESGDSDAERSSERYEDTP